MKNFTSFTQKLTVSGLIISAWFCFNLLNHAYSQALPPVLGTTINVDYQVNSGDKQNAKVDRPTGAVAGDLLVMVIYVENGNQVSQTNLPVGGAGTWTRILNTNQTADFGMQSFYKVATDNEPANYLLSLGTSGKWAISCIRVTGANTTNPINIYDGQSGTAGNSSSPSVTTTVNNNLVLSYHGRKNTGALTADPTTTYIFQVNGDDVSNMLAIFTQSNAGATGAKNTTGGSSYWAAQQISINPYPDMFRTRQDGDWDNSATWEQRSGSGATFPSGVSEWVNTTNYPDWATRNYINDNFNHGHYASILNTHDVTSTGNASFGNTTVYTSGSLLIADGVTLAIPSGKSLLVDGTLQMPGSSYISGAGDFTLSGGALIGIGSADGITAAGATGNIQNSGATRSFSTAANYTYNGTVVQYTGNGLPSTVNNLTVNNSAGVTLSGNLTVSNILTLTGGVLTTGSNILAVSNNAAGAVVGGSATAYVNGELQRAIAAGTNTYHFPVGSNPFTPVSIDFNTETVAGELSVSTTPGDHPQFATSTLDEDKSVFRYWTLQVESGLETVSYDATFTWVEGDEDEDFDYTKAYVAKYDGSEWSFPERGTLTTTSAEITGQSSFSDFQVGNQECQLVAFEVSGDASVCYGANTDITLDGSQLGTIINYIYSLYANGELVEGSEKPGDGNALTWTIAHTANAVYTVKVVKILNECEMDMTGSATILIGPITTAPDIEACPGDLVEFPITVKSFTNVGAISLILKYETAVLEYTGYVDYSGTIDDVYVDESGEFAILNITGIAAEAFDPIADGGVLLTLQFTHLGGNTALTWDDTGDGTQCEFASGAPNFQAYCDVPTNLYYFPGSVIEDDALLVPDFAASGLAPPRYTNLTFTDLSAGTTPTAWEWSFNPNTVTFEEGTDANSQEPIVQFTGGGQYSVTLKVIGILCEKTVTKTNYIHAGIPGLWAGIESTDWDTQGNWDNKVIPNDTVIVTVPGNPEGEFFPIVQHDLITAQDCLNLVVEAAAKLTILGELIVIPGTEVVIKGQGKVEIISVP